MISHIKQGSSEIRWPFLWTGILFLLLASLYYLQDNWLTLFAWLNLGIVLIIKEIAAKQKRQEFLAFLARPFALAATLSFLILIYGDLLPGRWPL